MDPVDSEADPWAWKTNETQGMHGDYFVRNQAEALLLERWISCEWQEAARAMGLDPEQCLSGVKVAVERIGRRFIDHVAGGYWLEFHEDWVDELRRRKGVALPGTNQRNKAVNLEAELKERLARWQASADLPDAARRGQAFLLGCVRPLRTLVAGVSARLPPGRDLVRTIEAQSLLEVWHESYVEVFDPLLMKVHPVKPEQVLGVRFAVVDAMRRALPDLRPTSKILAGKAFDSYMLKKVMPRWRAHFEQVVGDPPGTLRHLALLDKPIEPPKELKSLAQGKHVAPSTGPHRLNEAFLGLPIQVVHEAEGQHFFLGSGFLDPLLAGLAVARRKEPTRVLHILHETHDSLAILLPSIGVANVGVGGWLVLPFHWASLGSVGPARKRRATTILDAFPERFRVETVHAGDRDFMQFLQGQTNIGTPIWLEKESIRATALELERQRLGYAAQSLVLELLAERYAYKVLKCPEVHAPLKLGRLECDIVAIDATSVHHIECSNSIGPKDRTLPADFKRKGDSLVAAYPNRRLQQLFVTKRRGGGNVEKVIAALEKAGIKVLTFDEDLKPLVPKQYGCDRISRVFPTAEDDPVWKTQQSLAEFSAEMDAERAQKPHHDAANRRKAKK